MPRATDGPRRERVLVLFDATAARSHDEALADYVDAVVRGLGAELVVACRPDDAEHYRRLAPGAAIEAGPVALRWRGIRMLWRQFALPRIARRHDVDVVHSPWPPVPLFVARPRVVTVHSMRAFDHESPRRPGDALRRAAVRTAVRAADEIMTLHRDIAESLESALGFSAGDVLVAPVAADLDRFAAAHRLAYRAAAALVPAETGPISLPRQQDLPLAVDGNEPTVAH